MFKKVGSKLSVLLFALLFLAACNSTANSAGEKKLPDDYPNQTVEVLVGFGAGGGTDLSARNMVESLNKEGIVDQSFIVENTPGAEGGIALRELSSRKGDEYTLEAIPEYGLGLWKDNSDLKDYTPIAQVATDYQTIAVAKDSPYDTLDELIESMKKDPKSVVISSATSLSGGVGWKWHQIFEAAGMKAEPNLVPMEGENAALTALLGGDADVTFVVPQLAVDHVEKGNIKLLAVMTDERTDLFPDVPTVKESELNVTYYRPRGFWMNGDISEPVADYWEDALEKMIETDSWKKYVENSGLLLDFKGREEYTDYIEKDGLSYKEYYDNFK
jgi:putative tricarboxylic transport membrane protein